MRIRAAREADAEAMGPVMVETYLTAHRGQMPEEAWAKRAAEWTPEVSAQGWVGALREIAADDGVRECIYVAVDEGDAPVGLAMGGPADKDNRPQRAAIYALYIRTCQQRQGRGRRLVQAVAAELHRCGFSALEIRCLAANAPARRFYESLGGRVADERLFDEEGVLLPEVVYEWPDIAVLVANEQPEQTGVRGI